MNNVKNFHLLNGDILTPEQQEIYKLKRTIEKFKEYDEKRKEYVKNIEFRLGQLESQIEEYDDIMADGSDLAKSRLKVKNQKYHIHQLQKQIQTLKYIRDNNISICLETPEDVQNKIDELLCENTMLKNENKTLRTKKKELQRKEFMVRRELGNQVSKVVSLENKLKENR